jgi:hypothetical protein
VHDGDGVQATMRGAREMRLHNDVVLGQKEIEKPTSGTRRRIRLKLIGRAHKSLTHRLI